MLPSWHAANVAIWLFALALQTALAVSVFAKRIARSHPAFTALILFYPVRAVLLFLLPDRPDPAAYGSWAEALSLLALLLEAWVALEIAFRLMRKGGWRGRRTLIPAAIAGVALVCAWVTLSVAPGRIVVDRAQVLAWWVFLALFAAVIAQRPSSRNLVRISAGLAAFSFCQLIALAGRAHAFLVRSGHAYVAWSYVPAGAYIFVVAFWLVFLRNAAAASVSERAALRAAN